MIEDAKAGKFLQPVNDRQDTPFRWAVSTQGLYRDYREPNIEGAYVDFATEMEGGLSEDDIQMLADMEIHRQAILEARKS
jgi:hypothetical protein